ncbi:DUF7606 domain-containing protein [Neisseriaceae bacterium B1]
MKKIITSIIGASALLVSLGAQAEDFATLAQEAADSTVKERQVNYTCSDKSLSVTYGFNKQGLPTFAQAKLNGKKWFMPIDLNRSNHVDTVFGVEDNYNLVSDYLSLNNYHQSSVMVQDASDRILFKNCTAKSSKKIKG